MVEPVERVALALRLPEDLKLLVLLAVDEAEGEAALGGLGLAMLGALRLRLEYEQSGGGQPSECGASTYRLAPPVDRRVDLPVRMRPRTPDGRQAWQEAILILAGA